MGVLSSLWTGVSGLNAQGEALNVVSDNIANTSTNGFKSGRTEFSDIVSRSINSVVGGSQIGRGVRVHNVSPVYSQGSIDSTERDTDLAVSGDGFFVVRGQNGEQSYTRDGAFRFDKEGKLVTADGMNVQGYLANQDGKIMEKLTDISVPRYIVPAKSTNTVKMRVNLDSRYKVQTTPFQIEHPFETAAFSTAVTVHDSKGTSHMMHLFFEKNAENMWRWHALSDGADIAGGVEGNWHEVATGVLTYDWRGRLETETVLGMNINFSNGAIPNQQINFDFGDALLTDNGTGIKGSTQYGRESALSQYYQDGAAAGKISSLSFDNDGLLSAQYTNGTRSNVAQVVLAKFPSVEKTAKAGHNRVKETLESGRAAIGKANNDGRGSIYSKSLERSTSDIATEFVKLIQNQRGFQANAKVISTTDDLLGEIINLKR